MTPVVAVLNRKGGAGKTSSTKDLGFALAEAGRRVLQVGLDPQSSLEVLAGLGIDTPPDRTVSRLLMLEEFGDAGSLDRVLHDTPWRTRLVPASTALATAERALAEPTRGGAGSRLHGGLRRLGSVAQWDIVLIDCPPGMTPLTMNALIAANCVLVPTQLDFLSVAGLAVLLDTVEEVREYDAAKLRSLGIVGTQADERTRHAGEIRAQLERLFGPRAGGILAAPRSATARASATPTPLVSPWASSIPPTASAPTIAPSPRSSRSACGGARRRSPEDEPQASGRRRGGRRSVLSQHGHRRPRGPRSGAPPIVRRRHAARAYPPGRRAQRGRCRVPARAVSAEPHRPTADARQQVRRHRRPRGRHRAPARDRRRHARRHGGRPRGDDRACASGIAAGRVGDTTGRLTSACHVPGPAPHAPTDAM